MLCSAHVLGRAACPVVGCPAVVLGEGTLVVVQSPVQVRRTPAVLQVAAKRFVVAASTSTMPTLPAVTVSRVRGVVGLQSGGDLRPRRG